ESAYTNLYIKNFGVTVETLPEGKTDWQQTPMEYAGSAWFDGNPRGKMRVYYSKMVLPWSKGAAPWLTTEQDESWDGKEGREVRVGSGYRGTMKRSPIAQLFDQRPMMIASHWAYHQTGVGFTPQYWFSQGEDSIPPTPHKSLSTTMREMLSYPANEMARE